MQDKNKTSFVYLHYSLNLDDRVSYGRNHTLKYNLPKKNIYESVDITLGDSRIIGYYLGLQKNAFEFTEVADSFLKRDWNFISGLSAQYMLFLLEEDGRKLTVFSDNLGNFPIYYTRIDNSLVFSPNIDYLVELHESLTLNSNTMLNIVSHLDGFDEETLFKEIFRIPPSCFYSVNNTKIVGLNSYLTGLIEHNSKQTVKKFKSFEVFQQAFFDTLELVISDYLSAIKENEYVSDLSSGFDSSVVSYMLNKLKSDTTNCYYEDLPNPFGTQDKLCISQFVKKHSLKLDSVFINNESLDKTVYNIAKYPHSYNDYAIDQRLKYLVKRFNAKVNFTGHGGDELFGIPPVQERFLVKPYANHAQRIKKTRTTVADFFTQKAVDIYTNSKMFEEAIYYPSFVSESVISNNQKRFPEYWNNNVCMLSPLTDPRLIDICQKAPTKSDGKPLFQKEFWRSTGPIIHVPRHFSEKKHDSFGSQLSELINHEKLVLKKYVNSSILNGTNLFRFNEIEKKLMSYPDNVKGNEMFDLYLVFTIRISNYLQFLSKSKKITITS